MWDIIEVFKKGCVIVLMMYLMEEVDILGDCVVIMVRGKLWCIGMLIYLKMKFGVGYFVNVSV